MQVVFIETRPMVGLNDKVREFERFTGWEAISVCSERNVHCFTGRTLIIPEINNLSEYNRLMTSEWFWKQFEGHVLICQHDSGLLRKGIDKFLAWDYIGAPWPFCSYGGNGGLSLRNSETMRKIVKRFVYNPANGNEDIYFSTIMHGYFSELLAPRAVCSEFSVESAFMLGTLGYHFGEDSKRYLGEREKEIILTQYGR